MSRYVGSTALPTVAISRATCYYREGRLTHVAQNCSFTYGLNATAKLWNGQSPRIVLATPLEIARADYTPIPAGTPSRLAAEMGTTAAKDRTEEYCRHRFEAFANSSPVEDTYDCSGIQQRAKLRRLYCFADKRSRTAPYIVFADELGGEAQPRGRSQRTPPSSAPRR